MITIRLTRAEAKFIRNRMRQTAMNEAGDRIFGTVGA